MDILNRAVNMTAQSPFDQQKNELFLALQVSEKNLAIDTLFIKSISFFKHVKKACDLWIG